MRPLACCLIPLLLVAATLLSAQPQPSPDDLVARLTGEDLSRSFMMHLVRNTPAVRAANELISMGDTAVPALEKALSSPDDQLRANAVFVLGGIRTPASAAARLKAMADKSPKVRQHALDTLPVWTDRAALSAALRALKDPDVNVRVTAAYALNPERRQSKEKLENNFALQLSRAIWPLLDDYRSRGVAARTLGKLGSNHAVQPLLQTLSDAHAEGRSDVITALGEIAARQAAPALLQFLRELYLKGLPPPPPQAPSPPR